MTRHSVRALFFVLTLTLFTPMVVAHAKDSKSSESAQRPMARLLRAEKKSRVKNLTLASELLEIKNETVNEKVVPVVILEGVVKNENWSLLIGKRSINLTKEGRFKVAIPLTSSATAVTVSTVGPFGEIQQETFKILFPSWDLTYGTKTNVVTPTNTNTPVQPPRSYSLVSSLGLSFLSYQQTREKSLSEIALTGKLSYVHSLNARWNLGVGGYFTLLPISATPSEVKARFLGLNARAGFIAPWLNSPWRLSFMAGGYYATMFVSGADFGFRNVFGPQVFPQISRTLSNGSTLSAYLKYSPVASRLALLSLSNRELALGVSWSRPVQALRSFTLGLDYSNLALNSPTTGVALSATSISLSAGYSW